MSGVGVIINERARYHRRFSGVTDKLRRALGDQGLFAVPDGIDELPTIARRFHEAGVDLLVIGGGDGTSSTTLTAFLDAYGADDLPPVLALRSGTMNTIGKSVGAPRGKPVALLERLLKTLAEGRPVETTERSSIMIRDAHNHRLGFLTGAGAVYGFLAQYYEDGGGQPTPRHAVTTLSKAVLSVFYGGDVARRVGQNITADVTIDGKSFPRDDYFCLAAGTVEDIGLGFRPWYRAQARPDAFQMLMMRISAMQFVKALPDVYRARRIYPGLVTDVLAKEVVINTPDGVVEFMCDGDLERWTGPVTLTVGPRVRFITRI